MSYCISKTLFKATLKTTYTKQKQKNLYAAACYNNLWAKYALDGTVTTTYPFSLVLHLHPHFLKSYQCIRLPIASLKHLPNSEEDIVTDHTGF